MKITLKKLIEWEACATGLNWFIENNLKEIKHEQLIKLLIQGNYYKWAYWLIIKLLVKKQLIQFAIYSSALVLPLFEKHYPDDDRPRKAIKAADNISKAEAAANAADAAYNARAAYDAAAKAAYDAAAYAAYAAANAAYAAYAAAYAAANAANAANAVDAVDAADAAADAADAAADAAVDNKNNIKQKIIDYGLKLIKENKS